MEQHVALVARKSTIDEKQVSLPNQIRRGRAWAARVHPDLDVKAYCDENISGIDMERAGWQEFAAAVRSGRVRSVWAYEQSRLTRAGVDTWDQVAVMLSLAGIEEVHTERQGAISVVEGNRLQGRLLAVIDQEERERIKVRVRDTVAELAAQGRPSGGRPYGYRWVTDEDGKKNYAINETEASIVREIAQRVLAGEPTTRIASDLRERGVPTARGGQWSNQHIRVVVTKPSVAGLRLYRGEIVGKGTWPPILDEFTWHRVRSALDSDRIVVDKNGKERRVPRTQRRGRRYLLTGGLAVCGRCRHPLIAQVRAARNRPDRSPIYSCHPRTGPGSCSGVAIVADPLENWVQKTLCRRLKSPAFSARLRRRPSTAPLIAEIDGLESELRSLAVRYGAGDLIVGEWEAARSGLMHRLGQARDELAQLATLDGDDLADLAARWDDLELARKRELLSMAIGEVKILPAKPGTRKFDRGRVKIRWRV